MINPFRQVNWKPGLEEKRKFAVSLMIGFPVMGLVIFVVRGLMGRGWLPGLPLWLAGGGCVVGLILWMLPGIATPFYVGWYFVSCCIGIVLGNLALTLFYYVMVTGVGLLLRLFKRNSVSKGFDKSAASYWQKSEPTLDSKRYYRQF